MKQLIKARKEFDRYMAFSDNQEAAKSRAKETIAQLLNEARGLGASELDILQALHPHKGDDIIMRSPGYSYHGQKGLITEINGEFATVKLKSETVEVFLSCVYKA